MADPPMATMSSRVGLRWSGLRLASTSLAPNSAKRSAKERPSPVPPPVITATRPSKMRSRNMSSQYTVGGSQNGRFTLGGTVLAFGIVIAT